MSDAAGVIAANVQCWIPLAIASAYMPLAPFSDITLHVLLGRAEGLEGDIEALAELYVC